MKMMMWGRLARKLVFISSTLNNSWCAVARSEYARCRSWLRSASVRYSDAFSTARVMRSTNESRMSDGRLLAVLDGAEEEVGVGN